MISASPIAKSNTEHRVSLDSYRGFFVLCMISGGLGFDKVAEQLALTGNPSALFDFLGYQFSHVDWLGTSFWDLIQPGFIFIVGVVMPFSVSSRTARGATMNSLALYAWRRSFILVLLGTFLSFKLIRAEPQLNWHLNNVLAQIGLGYGMVFLLVNRHIRWHLMALAIILVGYWAIFTFSPSAPMSVHTSATEFSVGSNGGLLDHWQRNANPAHRFDVFLLNMFPRQALYQFSKGGYQTLNFIPSIATMILGLMLGQYLQKARVEMKTLYRIASFGLVCTCFGYVLGETLCPIIKRLWTPSWVLFSGGLVTLGYCVFFYLDDILRLKRWHKPLLVFGRNPIMIYVLYVLFASPASYVFNKTILSPLDGFAYLPILQSLIIVGGLWIIAFEMDRRKIYIRI